MNNTIEFTLDYNNTSFRHIEFLFHEWMGGKEVASGFQKHLFFAIREGDIANRRKLAKGFPFEVLAYFSWFYKGLTDERLGQIEKEYSIRYNVTNLPIGTKLFHKIASPEIIRKKISATWNDMVDNQSEEATIVEFLVNSQHGVYIPQQLGLMLDIQELKERDPYSEGYWDWWTYEIQPTIDKDLEKLLGDIRYPDSTLSIIDAHPEELAFTIDYHGDTGDMVLMMQLPEGYWESKR
jgi:hypothetical protein